MGKDLAGAAVASLLRFLEEGYRRKAWHGPNLRGSLRGLTPALAAWRPGPGRHNIWEIVLHCAYWKYAVRRRILGGKRGSFPVAGSNWFRRPLAISETAWRGDLVLLDGMHRALHESVSRLAPGDLRRIPKGSTMRLEALIAGVAAHDIYHAGQIQLLKRLLPPSA